MNIYALQMADPNLLSYSTLQELQGCPRKFELNKLLAGRAVAEEDEAIDFAFGHAVAAGVQAYLHTGKEQDALLACFLNWKTSLLEEDTRKKKSAWYAAAAVRAFIAQAQHLLPGYELVYFNGQPAIEASFIITGLPHSKRYRGDIDAVLKHSVTGKIIVLEIKTTSFSNVHEAVYKNSAQALGYGIVLDQIAEIASSYTVMYLVYETKSMQWRVLPFVKMRIEKARWIKTLVQDVKILEMYEREQHYPQRGQHCYSFFKPCQHFQYCGQSNQQLGLDTAAIARERSELVRRYALPHFTFNLTLQEIISKQLELLG